METHRRYRDNGRTRQEDWAYCQPLADLLRKQRQGKFLTPKEKERIKREAEAKRKSNLVK
jgi:hypothetical protein